MFMPVLIPQYLRGEPHYLSGRRAQLSGIVPQDNWRCRDIAMRRSRSVTGRADAAAQQT
jgi:hypothetical protein